MKGLVLMDIPKSTIDLLILAYITILVTLEIIYIESYVTSRFSVPYYNEHFGKGYTTVNIPNSRKYARKIVLAPILIPFYALGLLHKACSTSFKYLKIFIKDLCGNT